MNWPIFVVSLVDDVIKRNRLMSSLKEIGLDAEIFDAVDARRGVPERYAGQIDRVAAREKLGRPMVDPEFGCALSHIELYRRITEQSLPGAIILEDDAELMPGFQKFYEQRCYQDYSLLHLDYGWARIWRWELGKRVCDKGIVTEKLLFNTGKTTGYSISLKAAEHLFEKALPVSLPADWPCELQSMDSRIVVPRLIRGPVDKKGSTIEQLREQAIDRSRKSRRASKGLKLVSHFRRLFPRQRIHNPFPRFYFVLQPISKWLVKKDWDL